MGSDFPIPVGHRFYDFAEYWAFHFGLEIWISIDSVPPLKNIEICRVFAVDVSFSPSFG